MSNAIVIPHSGDREILAALRSIKERMDGIGRILAPEQLEEALRRTPFYRDVIQRLAAAEARLTAVEARLTALETPAP